MSIQLQEDRDIRLAALPRLLSGIPAQGAMSLPAHLNVHGRRPVLGVRPADGRRPTFGATQARRAAADGGAALIDELARAGLRGRGGAGFPTAAKMRAVAAGGGSPVVVVNATEGEPASMKDRLLIQSLPHLVLDGAALAAEALDGCEAIVCICEDGGGAQSLQDAIMERQSAHEHVTLHCASVPNGYVTGQESALVHYLNGGPALPTFAPPMPFESGVQGRPTLVCNAETLAHLAMIARRGAQWYRQLGTETQPGSTLVSLCGPVAYPGVYEIEHGTSLSRLIEAAGGLTDTVRAALIGGYAGTWIDGRRLHALAISDEQLAGLHATVGAGVIALLSAHACPVAETSRLSRWLADQSAGQCGPCVNGLHAIAATFAQVARGTARQGAAQNLTRLISLTRGRGACRHPDGAVELVQSAVNVFAQELSEHARRGLCDACRRAPELPLPAWSDEARAQQARRTRGASRGGALMRRKARA